MPRKKKVPYIIKLSGLFAGYSFTVVPYRAHPGVYRYTCRKCKNRFHLNMFQVARESAFLTQHITEECPVQDWLFNDQSDAIKYLVMGNQSGKNGITTASTFTSFTNGSTVMIASTPGVSEAVVVDGLTYTWTCQ